MIVKASVTPDEKARIEALASEQGMSVSAYLKSQALCCSDKSPEPIMQLIEAQAPVLQRIHQLATESIQNKVVYEYEICELLNRVAWLEDLTAAAVKEVLGIGRP